MIKLKMSLKQLSRLLSLLLLTNFQLMSQEPEEPSFKNFEVQEPASNLSVPSQIRPEPDKSQRGQRINSEVLSYHSSTPDRIFDYLRKDGVSLMKNSFIPSKQLEQHLFIQSLTQESSFSDQKRSPNELPELRTFGKKKYFEEAFEVISQMLDARSSIDLKRAVFLTENAFNTGSLNDQEYYSKIRLSVQNIKEQLATANLELTEQNINRAIFRFFTDTLAVIGSLTEKSYPKTYDFDDPFGIEDPNSMFVSKLLNTGKGQCKSLPLLYLILVQELGGKAYLSFSPSHTFIKCRDTNGRLYNIELTNGRITSDSWLLASGRIKSQAIRGGIYLDTMNVRQVLAHCLVDLSMYYRWNFAEDNVQMGYDSFSLKCINRALEETPNDLMALLEKSNYYTALLNYLALKKGYKTEEELIADSETREVFLLRNKMYALTDGLGYEYIQEEAYLKWLRSE